LQHLC